MQDKVTSGNSELEETGAAKAPWGVRNHAWEGVFRLTSCGTWKKKAELRLLMTGAMLADVKCTHNC